MKITHKEKVKMGRRMMTLAEWRTKGLPWFRSKLWVARREAIQKRVNKKKV